MKIAFVVEAFPVPKAVSQSPWFLHASELAKEGIEIQHYRELESAWSPFDAMILMVWLDWANVGYFKPAQIIPVMEKYSAYRASFPKTVQIILNHVDMSRRPYATPYWRMGDPILYRTPAYDRKELAPFPPRDIFAYEKVWGSDCFSKHEITRRAGFIGTPSGPNGYRQRVAAETAKVGIGRCDPLRIPKPEYTAILGSCRIIVCPQGWGENSERHWDAWRSRRAVLTDRACDSVEMIPGQRLRENMHYLVYDDPAQIPDIVSDWSSLGRIADLEEIASNGWQAALNYDSYNRILGFFRSVGARAAARPSAETGSGATP
jgi:hypothetical protein